LMAIKAIFFCGHKSRYGLAHLEPILNEFDVTAVMIPTDERWALFSEKISGRSYQVPDWVENLKKPIRGVLKKILSIRGKERSSDESGTIEQLCLRHHISLFRVFDVNEESFIQKIKEYHPLVILSAAYPQIFCKALISVPERGAINFHPSLLPRFRGAHPHFWSIATGEKLGGITAHFMTEKIDNGEIIAQIEFPIGHYYYGDLYKKMIDETPTLVKQVRVFLQERKKPIRQDPGQGTYFRNDREIHHRIFWNLMSGQEIHNLVRTERAFCFFRGEKIWIKRADLVNENRNTTNAVRAEPGTIVDIDETAVVVVTEDFLLAIHVLEKGGKAFQSQEWVLLNQPCIGEKFN
jgi:methionyl-tRNA formyltransferase